MRLLPVSLAFALLALHAAAASGADTCALLPPADAAALLEQPAAQGMPAGPQRDEDTGGQLTYCTYRGAAAALVVSVVEFSSAAEARKQLTNALVRDGADADNAKVTEEAGVGDKAYYGVSAKGATYVFLKSNKVVAIGIGGRTPSSKESLRRAALSVAAKV